MEVVYISSESRGYDRAMKDECVMQNIESASHRDYPNAEIDDWELGVAYKYGIDLLKSNESQRNPILIDASRKGEIAREILKDLCSNNP